MTDNRLQWVLLFVGIFLVVGVGIGIRESYLKQKAEQERERLKEETQQLIQEALRLEEKAKGFELQAMIKEQEIKLLEEERKSLREELGSVQKRGSQRLSLLRAIPESPEERLKLCLELKERGWGVDCQNIR